MTKQCETLPIYPPQNLIRVVSINAIDLHPPSRCALDEPQKHLALILRVSFRGGASDRHVIFRQSGFPARRGSGLHHVGAHDMATAREPARA